MKKNTNVDENIDYDFTNDSFTNEGISIPLDEEELEGALEYLEDILKKN